MIDRELVTRKMVLISEDLRRLEALAGTSREEHVASETMRAALTDVPLYLSEIRRFLDARAAPPSP